MCKVPAQTLAGGFATGLPVPPGAGARAARLPRAEAGSGRCPRGAPPEPPAREVFGTAWACRRVSSGAGSWWPSPASPREAARLLSAGAWFPGRCGCWWLGGQKATHG